MIAKTLRIRATDPRHHNRDVKTQLRPITVSAPQVAVWPVLVKVRVHLMVPGWCWDERPVPHLTPSTARTWVTGYHPR